MSVAGLDARKGASLETLRIPFEDGDAIVTGALSLHDALPILGRDAAGSGAVVDSELETGVGTAAAANSGREHEAADLGRKSTRLNSSHFGIEYDAAFSQKSSERHRLQRLAVVVGVGERKVAGL